jgi:hypothetical protein
MVVGFTTISATIFFDHVPQHLYALSIEESMTMDFKLMPL